MMQCIKTGGDAYSTEYGELLHGDWFEHNGVLLGRVCEATRLVPVGATSIHFLITKVGQWFDKDNPKAHSSTLVATVWFAGEYNGSGFDKLQDRQKQWENESGL